MVWAEATGKETTTLPTQAEGRTYAVIELIVQKKPMASPALLSWLEGWSVQVQDGKEIFKAAKCWWPRSETRLNDYLILRRKPRDDWVTFKDVRVFSFCRTLASAKSKAEKLLYTSDVSELSDNSDSSKSKRSRKQPARFGQMESSEDEDDDQPLCGLKISKASEHQRGGSQHNKRKRNTSLSSDDSSGSISESPFDDGSDHDKSVGSSGSSRTLSSGTSNIITSVISVGASQPQQNSKLSANADQPASPACSALTPATKLSDPPSRLSADTDQHSSGGFNTRVLAHVSQIRHEVSELRKLLLKVYITICGPQDGAKDVDEIPGLPLKDEDDFQKFETLCLKEDAKLGMVKFIAEYGTSELRDSVYNMLKKLLTNELAMNYNVSGVNRKGVSVQKKKFSGSAAFIVLKAAVKQHSKLLHARGADSRHQFNTEEFTEAVSRWLKDAKKRATTESKKRKRQDGESSDQDI